MSLFIRKSIESLLAESNSTDKHSLKKTLGATKLVAYRTPAKSNILLLIVMGTFSALVPARVAGEMTSIGTLLAFILVCVGILVMRKTMPNVPRAFKTPFVPLVPVLGIITCLFMMVFLPADTWIRLLIWMTIGLDVYIIYGFKNSRLQTQFLSQSDFRIFRIVGLVLTFLLIVVALWAQQTIGWSQDEILIIITLIVAIGQGLFIWIGLRKSVVYQKLFCIVEVQVCLIRYPILSI